LFNIEITPDNNEYLKPFVVSIWRHKYP
jgi:hypothetical protein